jgi:acetyltransferase
MEKHTANRYAALDGLRGLALVGIFIHHAVTHNLDATSRGVGHGVLGGTIAELRLGLISFFVLSGFLIYRGFAKALHERSGLHLWTYVKRRAARILPAYYLAITGAIILLWGAHMPELKLPPVSHLPLFAVIGQNYSDPTMQAIDGPTWTLGIEAAFYVFLPLVAVLLWRFRAGVRAQVAALIAIGAAGLAWRSVGLHMHSEIWDKGLPAWLPYFAIGMGLAVWAVHGKSFSRRLRGGATAALVAAAIALVVLDGYWHATTSSTQPLLAAVGDVPAALGFALLIIAGLSGTGPAISWLRVRPLVGLGVISYGFYLWHLPLMLYLRRLGIHGGFATTAALALPLSLAAGIASWKLVEEPLLRRTAAPKPSVPARRPRPRARPVPQSA